MNDEYAANAAMHVQALKQELAVTHQKVDQLTQAVIDLANLLKVQQEQQLEATHQAVNHALNPIHSTLFQLKSLTSYLARHQPAHQGGLIRVVFLVHQIESWDALHSVYMLMKEHPRFDPIVATLFHDYLGSSNLSHEEECYAQLVALGLNPIRFNNKNSYLDLEMLKIMDPDIIFRQSPWDMSIAPAFRFNEVNFAKICYVPYGLLMIPFKEHETNAYFFRSCWRVYYDHPAQESMLAPLVKKNTLRLAGSTKLERILQREHEPAWPLPVLPNTIRVIWAPHHTVQEEGWLCFSTFMVHYQQFLQLARECPEIQIVLKPHQLTFDKIIQYQLMSQEEMDAFIHEWTHLPNTALVTGGDYFPMMWASDLMITDGISFFAEYMVTGKPLIWTKNSSRRQMNAIGELLVSDGTYHAEHFDQVIAYIEQLFVQHQDPLYDQRKALKASLFPSKKGSAQYILDDIIQGMDVPDSVPLEVMPQPE